MKRSFSLLSALRQARRIFSTANAVRFGIVCSLLLAGASTQTFAVCDGEAADEAAAEERIVLDNQRRFGGAVRHGRDIPSEAVSGGSRIAGQRIDARGGEESEIQVEVFLEAPRMVHGAVTGEELAVLPQIDAWGESFGLRIDGTELLQSM